MINPMRPGWQFSMIHSSVFSMTTRSPFIGIWRMRVPTRVVNYHDQTIGQDSRTQGIWLRIHLPESSCWSWSIRCFLQLSETMKGISGPEKGGYRRCEFCGKKWTSDNYNGEASGSMQGQAARSQSIESPRETEAYAAQNFIFRRLARGQHCKIAGNIRLRLPSLGRGWGIRTVRGLDGQQVNPFEFRLRFVTCGSNKETYREAIEWLQELETPFGSFSWRMCRNEKIAINFNEFSKSGVSKKEWNPIPNFINRQYFQIEFLSVYHILSGALDHSLQSLHPGQENIF